jgi:hypothetical protein
LPLLTTSFHPTVDLDVTALLAVAALFLGLGAIAFTWFFLGSPLLSLKDSKSDSFTS